MSPERINPSDQELWRSLAAGRDVAPAPLSDLELADILGKTLPAAPARLEVRARALVGFEAERVRVTARASLFDWLFAKDRRFVMQRVVALTAAVMIAVSGFMLGGGLGETMAQERYAANWPRTDTGSN